MNRFVTTQQLTVSTHGTARRMCLPFLLALSTAGASARSAGEPVARDANRTRATDSSIVRTSRRPEVCTMSAAKSGCKSRRLKASREPQTRGAGVASTSVNQMRRTEVTRQLGMLLSQMEKQAFSLRFKPNEATLLDRDELELGRRTTELMHDYNAGARLTIVALLDNAVGDPATSCDENKLPPKADGCGFSCDGGQRALLIRRACYVRSFLMSRSRSSFWSRVSTAIGPTPAPTLNATLTPTPTQAPQRRDQLAATTSQTASQPTAAKIRAEAPAASHDGSLIRFKLRVMDALL
jgi:hypothetical protein